MSRQLGKRNSRNRETMIERIVNDPVAYWIRPSHVIISCNDLMSLSHVIISCHYLMSQNSALTEDILDFMEGGWWPRTAIMTWTVT